MKQRTTPRIIPDRSIYFTVETTEQGVLHFRSPSPTAGLKAFRSLREGDGVLVLSLAGKALAPDVMLRLLAKVGPDLISMFGYFIGICWYAEHLDLETPKRNDVLAYGESVVEELHEADWGMPDMITTAALIVTHWMDQQNLGKAAVDQAANFPPSSVVPSTSSSTSESTTSETPGATTN